MKVRIKENPSKGWWYYRFPNETFEVEEHDSRCYVLVDKDSSLLSSAAHIILKYDCDVIEDEKVEEQKQPKGLPMHTVPFNYDLIKEGYKPVTRDGKYPSEVYRFETLPSNSKRIVFVLNGNFVDVKDNGFVYGINSEVNDDLLMEPPVMEKFAPIMKGSTWYDTAAEAGRVPGSQVVKAIFNGDKIISIELVNNEL